MVLLGLVAVIIAIVLIIVRPGSSQGDSGTPPTAAPTTAAPEQTAIPTEPTAADGDPCAPEKVTGRGGHRQDGVRGG